jgi:hypothetical protein
MPSPQDVETYSPIVCLMSYDFFCKLKIVIYIYKDLKETDNTNRRESRREGATTLINLPYVAARA